MDNHYIYHLTQAGPEEIKQKGFYDHPSLVDEGFIHFSTSEQVHKVYQNFYSNLDNLTLLQVDVTKLNAELVYEKADDLNDFFPHLFGKLNIDAIQNFYAYEENKSYPSR